MMFCDADSGGSGSDQANDLKFCDNSKKSAPKLGLGAHFQPYNRLSTFWNFFKLALLALASMYSSVKSADIFSAAAEATN